MPITPLDKIESYTVLRVLLDEVEQMSSRDIYDPEVLTVRCASVAKAAAQAAQSTVGRVTLEGMIIVNQMVADGKLTVEESKALLPDFISADLSKDEIVFIASVSTSWYDTSLLLRVARVALLGGAFVVSFLSEQWIRTSVLKLPDDPKNLLPRLIVAALVFVTQLSLFGRFGETIERRIQWNVFHYVHGKLLPATQRLIAICSRAWNHTDSILAKLP